MGKESRVLIQRRKLQFLSLSFQKLQFLCGRLSVGWDILDKNPIAQATSLGRLTLTGNRDDCSFLPGERAEHRVQSGTVIGCLLRSFLITSLSLRKSKKLHSLTIADKVLLGDLKQNENCNNCCLGRWNESRKLKSSGQITGEIAQSVNCMPCKRKDWIMNDT